MLNDSKKQLSLNYVYLWILLSILLVLGTAFMGWLYYLHLKNLNSNDAQYNIVAIVQKTSQSEPLKTAYLAELLELSFDKPINIYQFNIKKAVEKLLSSPLIKKAEITKIRPGTLYIDYQMRSPMAFIGNYKNAAIDHEGYLFPFKPFFTPKALPVIYLNHAELPTEWGESIKTNPQLQIAFQLLKKVFSFNKTIISVKQIDVSQAFSEQMGKREIILILQIQSSESSHKYLNYLRLNASNYKQNIQNYMYLLKNCPDKKYTNQIIDFRTSPFALIKEEALSLN